ncbi:hypothetical protein CGRA01v4_14545 [Colletotrichum graminicola]|nr:hypothetical protein CGRA01v4_14545 [Colletotrichum graminicola]
MTGIWSLQRRNGTRRQVDQEYRHRLARNGPRDGMAVASEELAGIQDRSYQREPTPSAPKQANVSEGAAMDHEKESAGRIWDSGGVELEIVGPGRQSCSRTSD